MVKMLYDQVVLIPSNIAINTKAEQNQESNRSRKRTKTKREKTSRNSQATEMFTNHKTKRSIQIKLAKEINEQKRE